MNFSTWIVSGLMIVIGAVWVIVYNADLLLGAVMRSSAGSKALAPLLRMSMAYPLASRFRTGTTLAMFTLVVFTLVTGSTSTGSFLSAFNDVDTFGGGFDIRATAAPRVRSPTCAPSSHNAPGTPGVRLSPSSRASRPAVEARQLGTGRPSRTYHVRGLDDSLPLPHDVPARHASRAATPTSRRVARRSRSTPGSRLSTAWSFRAATTSASTSLPSRLQAHGLLCRGREPFDPVPVDVLDQQSGKQTKLTIIGVLADTAPLEMSGISTSQSTLAAAFPGRTDPDDPLLHAWQPGVDADAAADAARGSVPRQRPRRRVDQQVVDDSIAANMTFNRLIQGFMALGLVVGVAALGVISARAVVERRQQIGVMRAIGFRRTHDPGGVPARVVVRRTHLDRRRHCASGCSSGGTSSRIRGRRRAGPTSRSSCPGVISS